MAMAVGEGGEQGATGGRLPRRPPGGAAPAQQRLLRQQAPLLSALTLPYTGNRSHGSCD